MDGRIVYCHGLPGSPAELQALGTPLPHRLVALDRLGRREETYESRALSAFDALGFQGEANLIGFSLGAMAAIHIAARRPAQMRKLVLISPAAPLQHGDFLPGMAGRPVFEAAMRGGASLRLISSAQWMTSWLAPSAMVGLMFRTGPGAERRLAELPNFRDEIARGIRLCTGRAYAAYRDELRAFVCPWQSVVDEVACPVEIWHGDADNWAPLAMAQALRARLGGRASLTVREGLGHYSTLAEAVRQLA